jgi:hypothetical protein
MSITSNLNTHYLFNRINYKSSNKPKNTLFADNFTPFPRNTNWRHLIIDLTSLKTNVIKTAFYLL